MEKATARITSMVVVQSVKKKKKFVQLKKHAREPATFKPYIYTTKGALVSPFENKKFMKKIKTE